MIDSKMKTAIIVGSSPIYNERTLFHNLIYEVGKPYLVAADGGIDFFIEEDICPDIFLGDMDSCQKEEEARRHFPELKINKVSPIKDDSDMELGIKAAIEAGCNNIYIFGGLGGKRLSHTMANIQLIAGYTNINQKLTFIGDGIKAYGLTEGDSKAYTKEDSMYVSVFPLNAPADITIKGLKYEFQGIMKPEGSLGVSNEAVNQEGYIRVNKGKVLVIEEVN